LFFTFITVFLTQSVVINEKMSQFIKSTRIHKKYKYSGRSLLCSAFTRKHCL